MPLKCSCKTFDLLPRYLWTNPEQITMPVQNALKVTIYIKGLKARFIRGPHSKGKVLSGPQFQGKKIPLAKILIKALKLG
jgi:hypothetical protein